MIRDVLLQSELDERVLNLGVGPFPVRFEPDAVLWMKQNEPVFSNVLNPVEVAGELGLAVGQIAIVVSVNGET